MTTGKQPALFETESPQKQGPVECLGMTFENDEARRAHFTELLREKLQDPAFRRIEGFPIGEDEDILALSDPPYYTACPNPFIEDFITHYGKPYDPNEEPYHREPFATDVSEGKNDPIYNAHSYHTKVPHKAIMRYILHYTEPNDMVLDGFCGTGMTGVAAQLCGNRQAVQELGYTVQPDGTILDKQNQQISHLGTRRAVLNDLSSIAVFIAGRYNTAVDFYELDEDKKRVESLKKELNWVYKCTFKGKTLEIAYVVWSDSVWCENCGKQVNTYDAAIDRSVGKILNGYPCPNCGAIINKSRSKKVMSSDYDLFLGRVHSLETRVPKLINAIQKGSRKRLEIPWREEDEEVLKRAERITPGSRLPILEIPYMHMTHERNTLPAQGITHTHHFYTNRNLLLLSRLWDALYSQHGKLVFTSFCDRHAVLRNRWLLSGPTRPLNNTLYVPPLMTEVNIFRIFDTKYKDIYAALSLINATSDTTYISNQSSTQLDQLPDNSIDYIFVDPPFGGNILYSDLNIVWEAWLGVRENRGSEAVVDSVQNKELEEYQGLMKQCFTEFYRCLKPGRWLTVEFHSSQSSVWNAIQESIQAAGFIIADVKTLDKVQGTIHQDGKPSSARQDLVITAYKPNGGLEERFKLEGGTEEGAWDFTRTHLRQLPTFSTMSDGQVHVIAERMNYLLYDRMVAFHVQRGMMVPLSAAEFYAGLEQRFPKRDEMYFLPDQVAEYDRKRMTVREVLQLQLFVTDESSAIQWLKQQLTKKPQTFQEIHPQFMKEIAGWQKYEKTLELSELLEQNFLAYSGQGPIPEQIWSWLQKSSTTREEMEGQTRETADAALRNKAKDRWYVPDPTKAGDLEKLREKTLHKEFEEYRESKQKRLRVFRLEAVRAGFKKAWQERDYSTIIQVAEKIPDNVLQEDPKLLMWYDQAITRSEM